MNIDKLIRKSIQSVLLEVVEGNSPDEVIFDGDKYVALEDASITLLYYKGKCKKTWYRIYIGILG